MFLRFLKNKLKMPQDDGKYALDKRFMEIVQETREMFRTEHKSNVTVIGERTVGGTAIYIVYIYNRRVGFFDKQGNLIVNVTTHQTLGDAVQRVMMKTHVSVDVVWKEMLKHGYVYDHNDYLAELEDDD